MKRLLNSTRRNLALALPLIFFPHQTDTYNEIIKALEKQTYDYVQEKVYLHLDKPYYAEGEDIWFKAYTVAGPNHTPTPLSENLYVELINPFGVVMKRHTVYMNRGLGVGDFHLPDSIQSGEYTIRAFTNWMRNFDEQFFFKRQIKIVDDSQIQDQNHGRVVLTPEIKFYPEGGNLVSGVTSKVAFEITNGKAGHKGQIFDQNEELVSSFEVAHKGLGSFNFIPKLGESYHAILEGSENRFELPAAHEDGFVMGVTHYKDQIWVRVSAPGKTTKNHKAFVLAHTRGLVGFASKIEWTGNQALMKIPKSNLNEGIVHITLFDNQWRPHAERLVFQYPDDEIRFSLKSDKEEYSSRDSTTIKIKLVDMKQNPLTGFFSLSAIDANQIDTTLFDENIISSLLLTSDIDGKITQAGAYLKTQSSQNLDLLLMTKGWRRFLWKDLLNDQFPDNQNEVEKGFTLTGNVTNAKNQKPLRKGKIKQIGEFQGIPTFAEAEIDGSGQFNIKGLYYYETDVLLQGENAKGQDNVVVNIDSSTSQKFPNLVDMGNAIQSSFNRNVVSDESLKHGELLNDESNREKVTRYLELKKQRDLIDSIFYRNDQTQDLGEVVIVGKRETDRERLRRTLFPRDQVQQSVDYDEIMKLTRPQSAIHALVGRIPSFKITESRSIGVEPTITIGIDVAAFTVDGTPMPQTFVLAIPPELIEKAEVIGNMIYLWTREDGFDAAPMAWEKDWTAGSTAKPNFGYYRSREFYKPNYGKRLPEHVKPDRRALIHWEPMIQTDENGEAEVTFYNADLESTIQVQLEGIWEGGIPLAKSINYEVKRK